MTSPFTSVFDPVAQIKTIRQALEKITFNYATVVCHPDDFDAYYKVFCQMVVADGTLDLQKSRIPDSPKRGEVYVIKGTGREVVDSAMAAHLQKEQGA